MSPSPVTEVGKKTSYKANLSKVKELISSNETKPIIPAYTDYQSYIKSGGYSLLKECIDNKKKPMDLIEEMGSLV